MFLFIVIGLAAVVVVAVLAFSNLAPSKGVNPTAQQTGTATPGTTNSPAGPETTAPTETGTTEPTETAVASALPQDLKPAAIAESDPTKIDLKTDIMAAGKKVMTYERTDPINFPEGQDYNQLEGVTTFRGSNYRDGGSYGTADVKEQELEVVWQKSIGAIDGWTGVGWTGQPLIVKWPETTKKAMNLVSDKKSKEDLKEVIYPTLDGNIYFFDLENGDKTRKNPIKLGVPTKGTASIDPRGYPILYTGQGIDEVNGHSVPVYFRAFSLIDQGLLWKFGGKDPFSHRAWQAYDSSPLIDAGSDTLVTGGENGVLYAAKLNTDYNEAEGKITMDPEGLVKYRYTTPQYGESSKKRWWGIENSIAGWRNYAFFTDNGGTMQCVDLNTMKVVYALDVTDDSDVSMPIEIDLANNTFYLYTGNEVDKQKITNGKGYSYHRKINGLTGEVIWEKKHEAKYASQGSGTLTSPILGKGDMSNLVIYSMTLVPLKDKDSEGKTVYGGRIVAYDRATGNLAWPAIETKADYWSSPLAIYDKEGKGYIVQCDRSGFMKLYEGSTGKLLDTLNLGSRIDATPAAYDDMIVVGTRGQKIFGIKIK